MKIILNQDVINLGEEGDVVVVKDGYARNYLLPQGIAVVYNRTNMAIVNSRAKAIEARKAEKRKASASLKERLDGLTLNLVVSAGDSGKLFGSVTSSMIQEALAKEGIEIERKKIEVASHEIKMIGNYSVRVRLYESDFSIVKLVVESEAQIKQREAEEKKAAEKAAKIAADDAKKQAAEAAAAEEVVEETAPVTE
ncbi:MAG: 50S ribosomal protein L9 [Sphaerochaetaceae bacterium]|nr:50S ribosomal protein L9 [Sphaerochaetaceae bacterium]MDC7243961.1 50S ribosomal protein L9 [Sphaerochaetaceae bacterium]